MPRKKISYESAIADLEKIISELEMGDIPLNELMEKYANAMELVKFCNKELTNAEGLINKELKINGSNVIEEDLQIEGE